MVSTDFPKLVHVRSWKNCEKVYNHHILPAANEKCYAVRYLERTYVQLRHHLGQTLTKKVELYILNEEIVKPNLKLYCSI